MRWTGLRKGGLLTVLLLAPLTSHAVDRFASPTGSGSTCSTGTPCSLYTAITQAMPGEDVVLKDGTYNGSARVDFGTGTTASAYHRYVSQIRTFRSGTAGNPITIRAENHLQAIVMPPLPADHRATIVNIDHDYITVRGIVFDGRKAYHFLLGIVGGSSTSQGIAGGQATVNNVTIEECQFLNGGSVWVSLSFVDTILIRHNFVKELGWGSSDPCCGEGMYISSTSGNPVTNVDIYGNTISEATGNVVDMKHPANTNINIHHNIFENLEWPTQGGRSVHHPCNSSSGCPFPASGHGYNDGMIYVNALNSEVENNIFRNIAGGGTWRARANANNKIRNNVVMNASNSSLIRPDSTYSAATLAATEISDNTYCGLSTYSDSAATTGFNVHDEAENQATSVCNAEVTRITGEVAALPRFTALATIDPPSALTVENIAN